MASDNLMTMEQPWMFRPTFADSWNISDIYNTRETDTFAKALQMSFSPPSSDGDAFSAEMVESLLAQPPLQTPTASENEINPPPRRSVPPPSGRVAKRKSRASKRSTTTFITADPANFRQMVQQVTGVRFTGLNNGQLPPVPPVLKPEPQRAVKPTFDRTGFLVDGSASSTASVAGAIDLDSFCSFPTLESWKVM